jgi:rSAM/selenodomain-associated transferase 1
VLPSLVLFARAPVPGLVKTRLAARLTQEGAARLYLAFLEDAARAYVCEPEWDAILAAEPDPQVEVLVRLFGQPWRREAQGAGDLGARLAAAFESRFAAGAPSTLVVGSDHPDLPRRLVREAFGRLAGGDRAVVIPAQDGGYCALGLVGEGAPVPEVFRDVPWSTPEVLDVTLERFRDAGIRPALLEPSYDVDRPEDLDRLRRDLAARDPAAPDYPRATARALERFL